MAAHIRAMRLELTPIGVVHSPFKERPDAPRQATAARDVEGTVELFAGRGFEDALSDVALWDHVWLITWFHHNQGFRPKVQPPRGVLKRGLFATRAPYRPNPIGLTAVQLLGVEELTLRVRGLDLLDGTPLLDLKPYVPYSDAIPGANHGWLDSVPSDGSRPADPIPTYTVQLSPLAEEQLAFLEAECGLALRTRILTALELGPVPHAYRRIRRERDGFVLSVRDFRALFVERGARTIEVLAIRSGYKPRDFATGAVPPEHAAFNARFNSRDEGPPPSRM